MVESGSPSSREPAAGKLPETNFVAHADNSLGMGEADGFSDLRQQSVRGFAWTLIGWAGNRIVVLVLTLMLARLLVPEDFGLVTAALTVIAFLDAALDLGLGAAVVYDQDRGIGRRVRTAFTLNIALSVTISLVGAACSPLIARVFGAPDQWLLFAVLFLHPLIRGCGLVNDAVLKRDLRFRLRSGIEILRSLVRVAVSLPLALAAAGAWSIALGILAAEFAATLALWVMVPIRPTLTMDRSTVGSLVRFGGWITLIRVMGSIRANIDYLIVGAALGATTLGYYGMAYKLPEIGVLSVMWMFTLVAYPIYSRARTRGPDVLNSAMLQATKLIAIYGFFAGTTLAVMAADLVPFAFSEQWEPATVPMIIISLGVAWSSIGWATGDVFPAIGRPGLLAKLDAPATAVMIVALLLGSRWGMVGVAVASLIFSAAYAMARVVIAARVTGVGIPAFLRALVPAAAVAVCVGGAGLIVLRLMPPGIPRLAVLTIVCVVAGSAAALFTARREILSTVGSLRRDPIASVADDGGGGPS